MDRDALEAKACVERKSAAVVFVGVDAQCAAALFACVAFVKIQHGAGVAPATKRGINGEGVHDHHFVRTRIDLPGRWRVVIALQFVEHRRANERAVGFLEKKIVTTKGLLEGLARWVNAAHPADAGASCFLGGEHAVVERQERVEVVRRGFAECDHGMAPS